MNGRTCASCGWNDDTVVDEVWGLPAPVEPPTAPATPQIPPPPSTVIAVPPQGPSAMPSSTPIPPGGYSAPPPPVPPSPTTAYPFGNPHSPQPSPQKSRVGLIIAGVVGVIVLAIGAFVVFGGGDDDESATDDTRTERTDRTDRTDDTTEVSTATTPAGDPTAPTGEPDPNRDYPSGVRTNFLDACEEGSPSSTCLCILEGLETVYTLEEFVTLEEYYVETNEFGPVFTQIVTDCQ